MELIELCSTIKIKITSISEQMSEIEVLIIFMVMPHLLKPKLLQQTWVVGLVINLCLLVSKIHLEPQVLLKQQNLTQIITQLVTEAVIIWIQEWTVQQQWEVPTTIHLWTVDRDPRQVWIIRRLVIWVEVRT